MLFPVLGAHISCAEFQYPDPIWKEMCGKMAHLVADSGNNKSQLGNLVEAPLPLKGGERLRQVPLFAHQVAGFVRKVPPFARKVPLIKIEKTREKSRSVRKVRCKMRNRSPPFNGRG
jgi:hypothetical protein